MKNLQEIYIVTLNIIIRLTSIWSGNDEVSVAT